MAEPATTTAGTTGTVGTTGTTGTTAGSGTAAGTDRPAAVGPRLSRPQPVGVFPLPAGFLLIAGGQETAELRRT
ncbi:hypothetical protein MXD58_015130, partial [Frankia sp. AgKG'84/4]|nr:hypothetical protein [Frankia sp. AgKG'84/4]